MNIFYLFSQDWANLDRYKAENLTLEAPAKGEKRIVFMGNSITENWGKASPAFFSDSSFVNRGISGQTTPQMLLRFTADVISLEPTVVVILAGTNDIAGNTGPSTLKMIMDNIRSMAQLAQVNNIKVVLCSLLPAYEYPWSPGKNPVENIAALNKMIEQYAIEHNHIYLDYYSAMVDDRKGMKREYSSDGVHPNKAAYNIMEPLVKEAIANAIRSN
jgi:lysophospholipase L1-like esterase